MSVHDEANRAEALYDEALKTASALTQQWFDRLLDDLWAFRGFEFPSIVLLMKRGGDGKPGPFLTLDQWDMLRAWPDPDQGFEVLEMEWRWFHTTATGVVGEALPLSWPADLGEGGGETVRVDAGYRVRTVFPSSALVSASRPLRWGPSLSPLDSGRLKRRVDLLLSGDDFQTEPECAEGAEIVASDDGQRILLHRAGRVGLPSLLHLLVHAVGAGGPLDTVADASLVAETARGLATSCLLRRWGLPTLSSNSWAGLSPSDRLVAGERARRILLSLVPLLLDDAGHAQARLGRVGRTLLDLERVLPLEAPETGGFDHGGGLSISVSGGECMEV